MNPLGGGVAVWSSVTRGVSQCHKQVGHGIESALELKEMLLTRRPEEIFAAEDQTDRNEWVEFFKRTREDDGRQKRLVEIQL